MVKNQTTNPELFPLELFVTLQIDADRADERSEEWRVDCACLC